MRKEIPNIAPIYPERPLEHKLEILTDELKYVHLQTPISLPNYFSPTSIINVEKVEHKAIKMKMGHVGIHIFYNEIVVIIPYSNIVSMVVDNKIG